ncbi:hypothetical protein K7B10_06620 [Streptomyces flavotricini]|uniref:Uncharacterized protein n=1 Tax=Streptomyces flavotricini TaxID=66888 RepID=A0ABS8E007_9ACTN|nr:hypothetical protein [Streptomyces flavotricini]MCC0094467.1 hypothetical protein [Streptomyces flavotricini]
MAWNRTPQGPSSAQRRVLAPLALAQFICSFAGVLCPVVSVGTWWSVMAVGPHLGPGWAVAPLSAAGLVLLVMGILVVVTVAGIAILIAMAVIGLAGLAAAVLLPRKPSPGRAPGSAPGPATRPTS